MSLFMSCRCLKIVIQRRITRLPWIQHGGLQNPPITLPAVNFDLEIFQTAMFIRGHPLAPILLIYIYIYIHILYPYMLGFIPWNPSEPVESYERILAFPHGFSQLRRGPQQDLQLASTAQRQDRIRGSIQKWIIGGLYIGYMWIIYIYMYIW